MILLIQSVQLALSHLSVDCTVVPQYRCTQLLNSKICLPSVVQFPVTKSLYSALVGLVRSYGTYLPEEKITMNALCPSVVRTNMSTQAFYDNLESMGIMTPIEGITETFEKFLGANKTSGICYEIGPNYKTQGAVETFGRPYIDRESAILFDKLYERSRPLHAPRLENTTRTD